MVNFADAISGSDLSRPRESDREPEPTHYIPVFTEIFRGRQRAVCGLYIVSALHTNEPSCPACAAYVTQQASDDEETAAALEKEYPEYQGRLNVPKETR